MRARGVLGVLLLLALAVVPFARAEPLVLAYGRLSQSANEADAGVWGTVPLATVVEHVEFLLAHGYRITDLFTSRSS